jgi:hypothetical protein
LFLKVKLPLCELSVLGGQKGQTIKAQRTQRYYLNKVVLFVKVKIAAL